MHFRQRTVERPVSYSGIGLHSGNSVNLTVNPAPVNHGIKFVRIDLPGSPSVTAQFNRVVDTSLATVIGSEGCIVSTIEHLMATFAGLSIDNALVELDAYEVPVLDGSAAVFTQKIMEAGIRDLGAPRHFFVLKEPIEVSEGDKSVIVYPSEVFKISCSISFDHPLIGAQFLEIDVSDRVFSEEVSKARTFGFLHEVEYMKRHGLALGGSLENAVVIDRDRILNEGGLRYPDEFVRHKVLDCLGDFSLLGMPILGHIVVNKSGHAINHAFLEKFFSQKESWETLWIPESCPLPLPKTVAI